MSMFRSLFLLWALLSWTEAKECGSVSRGKQVKELVHSSHVLVALLDSDEDPEYKELCQRLQQTPAARVEDFEIVAATDKTVQRKVWEESIPAPQTSWERFWFQYGPASKSAKSELPTLPAYVLFTKGGSFESGRGLQLEAGTVEGSLNADSISSWVSEWLRRPKVGAFVYSLGTYDLIAAQTMALAEAHGNDSWKVKLWINLVGRATKYLIHPTTAEFESNLAEQYLKSAQQVHLKGALHPHGQIERLERMLNNADTKLSDLQREELSQRVYIWKKFVDPVEFSNTIIYQLLGRLIINAMSLISLLVLLPFLLFSRGDEEEAEEAEEMDTEETTVNTKESTQDLNEEEEKHTVLPDEIPSVDAPEQSNGGAVGDEPQRARSKAEILAEKKARAAASMAADKAKVQATLARKRAGVSEPSSSFTSQRLAVLTVTELKEMLKERNLRVSGKKTELIDRLLEYGK